MRVILRLNRIICIDLNERKCTDAQTIYIPKINGIHLPVNGESLILVESNVY